MPLPQTKMVEATPPRISPLVPP